MDLHIAAVKYTANALQSWHLPSIADQALSNGYYSDALVALASEAEPIMSNVGPLFERALADCSIQIPSASEPTAHTLPVPNSTQTSEFRRSAENMLRDQNELFVLQRFAYTAGAGSGWHLFRDYRTFQSLLAGSPPRTAITLVLDSPVLDHGIADDRLRSAAIKHFRFFGDLAIAVIPIEDTHLFLTSIEWTVTGFKTADAIIGHQAAEMRIRQCFDRADGQEVLIARDPDWWDDGLTAYVPDSDGVARVGAY